MSEKSEFVKEEPRVKSPTSLHGADSLTPVIAPGPTRPHVSPTSRLALQFWEKSPPP